MRRRKDITELGKGEMLSYALTNTGQTMIYCIFGFVMQYMTDVLTINVAIVGTILLFTRIWDAVNDPIMGMIVDKTRTKWGKCRPYMLFTPVPVALALLLLYSPLIPTDGSTTAIVLVAAFYVVFDAVYTLNDVPYWGMSSVITTNQDKRIKLVSVTRIIGGCGSAIVTATFMIVVSQFNKSNNVQNSYFLATLLFCIIGTTLMLQGFFNTKERATKFSKIDSKPEKTKGNAAESLKLIFKCPLIVINLIAGSLYAITTIGTLSLTTYYAKWNVWNLLYTQKDGFVNWISKLGFINLTDPIAVQSIFAVLIGVLPVLATLFAILFTPALARRFEKRNILIIANILGAISNIAFFFIGKIYPNLLIFMVGRFVSFIPLGFWTSITTSMFGDGVDYVEWQTGKRTEGASFSVLTFVGKFSGGIAALVMGLLLGMVMYNEALGNQVDAMAKMAQAVTATGHQAANLDLFDLAFKYEALSQALTEHTLSMQQPKTALDGIFAMTTIVAGIGQIICIIPFFFYKFNKKKHAEIIEEIKKRKFSEEQAELASESIAEPTV